LLAAVSRHLSPRSALADYLAPRVPKLEGSEPCV
jgi:hypothetical protein